MSEPGEIRIVGARQHNLKNISCSVPRNKLVVITGPSGSGKSSLAFDTLFSEGQRRYVQSLSSYARQFLDQMEKPDVDLIEGLSPAVAIEQRTSGSSPRSTVATSTEIYDFLRLLYSSLGRRHHPKTGKPLVRWTSPQIVDRILTAPEGAAFNLLAPIVSGQKGELRDVFEHLKKDGFLRARVDGEIRLLEEPIKLSKSQPHTVEVVIDRLKVSSTIQSRLAESLELALKKGGGVVVINWMPDVPQPDPSGDWVMSNQDFDPETGYRFPELGSRHFSFNNPLGACPHCHGLGGIIIPDDKLIVPDPGLSLKDGAIRPWARMPKRLAPHFQGLQRDVAKHLRVSLDIPWANLPTAAQNFILFGSGEDEMLFTVVRRGEIVTQKKPFEGVLAMIQNLYDTSTSQLTKVRLKQYMSRQDCTVCHGTRLRPETLAVRLPAAPGFGELNIYEFCDLGVGKALRYLNGISWSQQELHIGAEVLKEVRQRLKFLDEVGLSYLSLNRETGTLSGGEAQRIRLATQIGSGLTGVLYILDEPSIGLHSRDQERLLGTLKHLRSLGNTVLVVEHDEETMFEADYILDMGPGAGARGGQVVAAGTVEEICKNPKSPTGLYLSGASRIAIPRRRTPPTRGWLTVLGARENNLQNIDAAFPIGLFTCVTGVSGSGKSTLVNDILSRALFRHFYASKDFPGRHDGLRGLDDLDKVIVIDQSPIGRTPRSNALTFSGAFDYIRDLFAQLPASRVRGYSVGRFSFNTPGGRCEFCKGDGYKIIEMNFLPDVYVPCEGCKGRRFNRETLEVTYKGHNIADILDLTVNDVLTLLGNVPGLTPKLEALAKVGLGYLPVGQSATTLSGGEAQRIKLAAELAKRATGRTVFILDEPTTGLHFVDVEQLLGVLRELRDGGNTIIVIEHHMDVIKSADYVMDLGPGGGEEGGRIVVCGTPEDVAACEVSHTGRFLKKALESGVKKEMYEKELV